MRNELTELSPFASNRECPLFATIRRWIALAPPGRDPDPQLK